MRMYSADLAEKWCDQLTYPGPCAAGTLHPSPHGWVHGASRVGKLVAPRHRVPGQHSKKR
jgi:hypothetical protein